MHEWSNYSKLSINVNYFGSYLSSQNEPQYNLSSKIM